jgi:hypothetical protein
MYQITNENGRAFNVRIVRDGERYGLKDRLTHEGKPLVEFYDATQDPAKFGPRGQFVSRYYASTLLERNYSTGLCLDGGNADAWSLDAAVVADALSYVVKNVEVQP